MKFSEIITAWELYKKHYVKRSSMACYSKMISHRILPMFGDLEIINENIVQIKVGEMAEQGLSKKSIKDTLIVLEMILKYGLKKFDFPYKGKFDIEYPRDTSNKEVEVFSAKDNKRLIEYLTDNFSFRNLGILICCHTGMRIGEICALRWSDIRLDNQTIEVSNTLQRIYEGGATGKKTEVVLDSAKTTSSVRVIPLNSDLMKILKPLSKLSKESYFLLTNNEKPTEPRTYRAYYHSLLDMLDLPKIKFHGLRHTFATRCINAKVDVKTLSVILGHANVGITMNTYVHPDTEQKRLAMNQVFKALKL